MALTAVLCALLLAAPQDPASGEEPAAAFYETATVHERPLTSATGSVTVLDRQAIETSGARTVAELLRFAPGLDVTGNGTRGGFTTAQIRGGDPNFTLVLLDGVPLNDATYQVGDAFNLEGLPAHAIERIEIVRGPLSSFYGSMGLAGVINIITRKGEPDQPTVTLEAGAGDASLRQVNASASGGLGRTAYFVGGSWEEEAGRVADESFRQANVHANLSAPLGIGRLKVHTRYASWEGDDYPDASGGPVYGSGELRRSDHREMSLGTELTAGRHRLTAAASRHELDRTSPAVVPLVPPAIEDTTFTTARLGWAATLYRAEDVQLSIGADVERQEGENRSLLLLPPEFGGAVPGDYSLTRTTPGAYAELIAERGELIFELGSRLDFPEDHAGQWSPRLGVSWRRGPTRLHASAGRAWKLPSFFALASPPALGGNPELRPEKALGGDLGIDRTWAAGQVETGATLFYNRFEDLIDFDFATFTHLNRAEVEARGIELTLAWRPDDRLAVHANATWQEVEDLVTAARLRHRPKWVGGLRIDWRPDDRLQLQLDAQGASASFDEQIPVPERTTVPGATVAGLAGSFRLAPRWQLRGRIDNLTDKDYETLIGFPGPGRSVRLALRYEAR